MLPSQNPNYRNSNRREGNYIICDNQLWWFVRPEPNLPVCLDPLLRRSRWEVKGLAHSLGIGTRTLTRVIDASIGLPAKEWLRRHRAVTACHLIREGWKFEALALELGFRYPSAFSREFKAMVGVAPARYLSMERSRFFIPPP